MNLQVAVHETAYVSTRTADKKSCWSKERAITVYQPQAVVNAQENLLGLQNAGSSCFC